MEKGVNYPNQKNLSKSTILQAEVFGEIVNSQGSARFLKILIDRW